MTGWVAIVAGWIAWLVAGYLFVVEIPWDLVANDPTALRYVPGYVFIFLAALSVFGGFFIVFGQIDLNTERIEKAIERKLNLPPGAEAAGGYEAEETQVDDPGLRASRALRKR